MKTMFAFLIGLVLIALLINYFGIENIYTVFSKIDILLFLASSICLVLMHIVLSLRINYISSFLGEKIKFKDAFSAHMLGMLLSEFTPGRSGYWLAPAYLKTKKMNSGNSLACIIATQPFDYAVKVLGASAGFILFIGGSDFIYLFALPIFITASFFVFVFSRRTLKISEKIFLKMKFFPSFVKIQGEKAFRYAKQMQEASIKLKSKFHIIIAFTGISYTLRVLNWMILAYSLGIFIERNIINEIFNYYLLQPLISLIEFVPLPSSAGTGLSESTAIFVFSKLGIGTAMAFAFALALRMQSIATSLLLGIKPLIESSSFIKKKISEII